MAALDDILNILQGVKVYDSASGLWRVYDQNGVELADPGGILLRGLHGTLLREAGTVSAGWIFGSKKKRRILVEIDGNRFLVPEDEIEEWVKEQQEKIVEQAINPIKPYKKVKQQKTEKIPEIEAKVDDRWIKELIKRANLAIREEIRRIEEDEDILVLLLAA